MKVLTAFVLCMGLAACSTASGGPYGSTAGYYGHQDLGRCAGSGGARTRQHPDSLCNRQNGNAAGSSGSN